MSEDPFRVFRNQCENVLRQTLTKSYPEFARIPLTLNVPSAEHGELSSPICFELSGKLGVNPSLLAERIVKDIDISKADLIESVTASGGYINFRLNFSKAGKLTIESVRKFDESYGYLKVEKPQRILVEHTSVNPIHAIHIGQARNPVLGDALTRILRARGHIVSTHYYVDDVGRQTAVIGYGYFKLGMPQPNVKPDHFIGQIYCITACLLEIQKLKKRIYKLRELGKDDEVKALQGELDEWVSILAELQGKYPKLFTKLFYEIAMNSDPEAAVNDLIQRYEKGESEARKLIRRVCDLCLEGFKQSLARMNVFFDFWDWESDLIWTGRVAQVLQRLSKTPYVYPLAGALELDVGKIVEDFKLKPLLGISDDYQIASLTLMRSDGTTLYTTRDIAYTLQKFENADVVINVIGAEQTLAQLQLKAALFALGYGELALKHRHFSFGLVELPGFKMSSRRGRFITLDQVLDEAVRRAYDEVSKRSQGLTEGEKRNIAEVIGVGAVKYALVSVEPSKSVVFDWDKALNFETNSGPFIQYAHARACNILKKAEEKKIKIEKPNYELLKEPIERDLIILLARFPEVFLGASENLRPDDLAVYANTLADKFNSFYASLRVIQAESSELRDARLALVDAVRIVLRNAMSLLGIEMPKRM